jgi:cytochrome c oxidase subunit 1
METHDSGADGPRVPQRNFLATVLSRSDHKTIGLRYLWLALASVFLGMILSLLMRLQYVWPAAHLPLFSQFGSAPDGYAALTLLHGSLMIFMVLTTAPQAGFASCLLPVQIGARDLAFPKLSAAAFWVTMASICGLVASFFLDLGTGIPVWIASVALFCAASLVNSINLGVTVIDLRAKGMTLPRLPVTVWAWFINAILGMLIYSILLAACVYLLADRFLDARIFVVTEFSPAVPGSSPTVGSIAEWQRLFWFFAQAQVYVALLPCFGLVTHLIATFARRPIWRQRAAVLALCGLGILGFCIWGEHVFESGLNTGAPLLFSQLAAAIGLPAAILVVSWFGTLWGAKIRQTTSMLFALGFISLFLSGGLSGLILARHDLGVTPTRDDFVSGHFHLVMGVAATFAMLGALFFWFPKMFGRHLDERLGKTHFWLTFVGVYGVFMPMHWLGLMSHSGMAAGNPAVTLAKASFLQSLITISILFTTAAQTFFVANFVLSLRCGGVPAEANPWRATTLEWELPSPPEVAREVVVYRGAYDFRSVDDDGRATTEDFVPQYVPSALATFGRRNRSPQGRGQTAPHSPQPAGAE